ncbi:MAG: radical SAM protein [Archaeoglobus sp.]|nr:radical SAM protein [Archaeoglobus sp.]
MSGGFTERNPATERYPAAKGKSTEHNPFAKKWRKGLRGVALVYPNRYVGGISNLGLQYIYSKINSLPGFICERFYTDVFGGLRSLETATPLEKFEFAFFSLQYEEDVFNIYEILKKSDFRGLKVAGGPCIMENPLPYAKLFDLMFVGEAENYIDRILMENLRDLKESELGESELGPFFIPEVMAEEGRWMIRRVKSDLRDYLKTEIIAEGAYGRALLLEIGRGCKRNCRFCLVKRVYSPVRWRRKELLLEIAEKNKEIVEKVALIAPSPSDHPEFKEILFELKEMGYAISPSSLRADKLDEETLDILVESGLRSLTIAPEAGSERMRKVVDKGITEDDVLNAAKLAAERSMEKIKLYFMIGLPGEKWEDLEAIIDISKKVQDFVRRVEVSVNPLVPKPHTPFQFLSFGGKLEFKREDINELKEKVRFLRRKVRSESKYFEFKPPAIEEFAVQTVISRGGEEVFELIKAGRKNAFRNIFSLGLEKYLDAMGARAVLLDRSENLPWQIIDHGYNPKRLEKEFKRAIELAELEI